MGCKRSAYPRRWWQLALAATRAATNNLASAAALTFAPHVQTRTLAHTRDWDRDSAADAGYGRPGAARCLEARHTMANEKYCLWPKKIRKTKNLERKFTL